MIVYVKNGAEDAAIATIQEALESRPEIIKNVEYCSDRLFAGPGQEALRRRPRVAEVPLRGEHPLVLQC